MDKGWNCLILIIFKVKLILDKVVKQNYDLFKDYIQFDWEVISDILLLLIETYFKEKDRYKKRKKYRCKYFYHFCFLFPSYVSLYLQNEP